jgi:hypothetical protein
MNNQYMSGFDEEWERIEPPVEPPPDIGYRDTEPAIRPGNRRRGERVRTRLPALVVTPHVQAALHGVGTDISLSGAHLDLYGTLPVDGDVVRLSLSLPTEMLHVWARKVRTTPRGQAVEFIGVSRVERTSLARYLHEQRGALR